MAGKTKKVPEGTFLSRADGRRTHRHGTKQGAKADHQIVLSLHCGGESVLWLEDDDYLPEAGEAPMRQRLTMEEFEALVAEQMVVAPQLLKLNYQSFKKSGREQIHFPRGWTARKR